LTVFEHQEGYYQRHGLHFDRLCPLPLVTYRDASDHVLLLLQQAAHLDDILPASTLLVGAMTFWIGEISMPIQRPVRAACSVRRRLRTPGEPDRRR
jgi:hypothetical protein